MVDVLTLVPHMFLSRRTAVVLGLILLGLVGLSIFSEDFRNSATTQIERFFVWVGIVQVRDE